jgi:hypothetical protein
MMSLMERLSVLVIGLVSVEFLAIVVEFVDVIIVLVVITVVIRVVVAVVIDFFFQIHDGLFQ